MEAKTILSSIISCVETLLDIILDDIVFFSVSMDPLLQSTDLQLQNWCYFLVED